MDAQQQRRLANLCAMLGITLESTEPAPEIALQVLTGLYAAPLIENPDERRIYMDRVRANMRGHFRNFDSFPSQTARLTTDIIYYPERILRLHAPTEVLVEQYKDIERAVWWLGAAGIGAGTGAAVAGFGEAIKTGSARAGTARLGSRLMGHNAITEALGERLRQRLPALARSGRIAGGVVVVGGTIAYFAGLERMEELKAVLMDRYQNGDMTDEQFRQVFGGDIDPTLVKRYWEM